MKKLPILIGSRAAKFHCQEFRNPKDWDYIFPDPEKWHKENLRTAHKIQECFYYPAFEWLYSNENFLEKISEIIESDVYIPSLDILYTIKFSHSFWDTHPKLAPHFWTKTMNDILFSQNQNCQLIMPFFELLYSGWENKYGKKKINLNVTNEKFFKESVDRIYDHDSLHAAISYSEVPWYKKLKRDPEKAWICQDLFENLSKEEKFQVIREETYVVALERFLIPGNFQMNILLAYRAAMKLLITSMTKGWFPFFIVLNWKELNVPDEHNFVSIFKSSDKLIKLPQKEKIKCL